jgi:IS1 family transposase
MTPSGVWDAKPVSRAANTTTNSWLFPPATQEVEFDEKWSFVAKKQKHCALGNRADARKGDCWDHVALDPEHRLVLSVVVGKRTDDNARQVVYEFRERTDGRPINLMTSDEYPAYAKAIAELYAEPEAIPAEPSASGADGSTAAGLPEWLVYATVHKTRENNRVVQVEARLVLGTLLNLAAALVWAVLDCVSTVFVERQHGSDRLRNARKIRKTYRFSKDWGMHEALTYFTMYSANFCCPVRTLREEIRPQRYRQRTPALAAGLTDHVWSLEEWVRLPGTDRHKLPPLSPKRSAT